MINQISCNRITQAVAELCIKANKQLPCDVVKAISSAAACESDSLALSVLADLQNNISAAKTCDLPICQDTGLIQFFVKVGAGFPYLSEIGVALEHAVRIATKKTPLRPNAVLPFDEKNTGDNIAPGSPWIEWEIVPDSDSLTLEIYMAGGGCSLPGKAVVLMPSAGYEGVCDVVLEAVCDRGINACPPLVIGVGIGTCADSAGVLSKKALLRKIGSENPHPKAAELEKIIKDAVNSIGIGPNALKGKESVLDVNVEYAAHHPATLAVGVSFGCWATRRGVIVFDKELNHSILSHKKTLEL
jgi:L(+)-tartrate dehydratase alpha subunit